MMLHTGLWTVVDRMVLARLGTVTPEHWKVVAYSNDPTLHPVEPPSHTQSGSFMQSVAEGDTSQAAKRPIKDGEMKPKAAALGEQKPLLPPTHTH